MKKTIMLLTVLCLLALALPAPAEEGVWSYDAYNLYAKLDGTLSGDVVVPDEVDGCLVNAIGSGELQNQHDVTSLTFPDTLRALQQGVVSFMDALTDVTLPEGLQVIGASNFNCCRSLESVTVPASVRYVSGSFSSCESLREVRFLGECPVFDQPDWLFDWLPDDCVIVVPDDQLDAYAAALADANGAASRLRASGQNAVVVENTIEESDFEIDAETGEITSYIGMDAWLVIPESIGGVPVRAIGEEAMRNDYSIYGLILPEGLETIGAQAFRQACNIEYIVFPSTLRTIGAEAFHNVAGSLIVWNEGLEEIGDRAFVYNRHNDALELPESLRVIGESAFENAWCSELYLGKNVERIGSRAFAGTSLNYLVFDLYAPVDIAPDAFADTCVEDLDLPWDCSFEVRDAYAALLAEQCPDCTVWISNPEAAGVAEYPVNEPSVTRIENGVWTVYTGDAPDLTVWTGYDDINVTALGDGVFKGNRTIRSFYPHHCGWFTTIGNEAFADSSVEYVELFGSITTIGDGAFAGCTNLTELALPASLETIGAGAFAGCTGITEITLPASLVSIGAGAFDGCTNLSKVTLLCDASALPEDATTLLAGVGEVYAAADATGEQVAALSAKLGRAWNDPLPRVGETPATVAVMPFAETDGDDFWYDEDYARLDAYQGYALNLVLPREIDGVALTMVGGNALTRASYGDNFDVELPVRSLVIPETYAEIPAYAFQNCDTLETVVCYAPLDVVPEGLFSGCTSLREVVFVNGVRSLDRYVFDGCESLEAVYLGAYTQEISEYAFLNMDGTEAFPQADCITDPTQMPDVSALLAAVRSTPMPTPEPTATPAPAMPVGEAGAPFVGSWYCTEMELEGTPLDPVALGLDFLMTLNADGTAELTMSGEQELGTWNVQDGVAFVEGTAITLGEDGTLCMDDGESKMIFTSAESYTPSAPEPAGAELETVYASFEDFVGTWTATVMETEGMRLNVADLGFEMTLTLGEDGAATLFSFGEEDTSTWTYVNGACDLDGTLMVMTADGELCMDDEGDRVYFVRGEGDVSGAPKPAGAELETVHAAQEDFVGTWTATVMETEGMRLNVADLGFEMTLTLGEDGAATLFSFGEEDTSTWTYVNGACDLDGTLMVMTADGELCMDDEGDRVYFVRGEAGEAPASPNLPDGPQTVGDGLLDYVGTWHAVYLSTGGLTGDPRTLGLRITLTLDADGTGALDYAGATPQVWYQDEETDNVYVGESADGVGMVLTLLNGGFMQYGTQLGGYMMFSRDEDADWAPEESASAPGVAAPVPEPAAPAAPVTVDGAYLERKFIARTAEVSGYTMPAANLGGEYAVTLHADGTADFVMVNVPVPALRWSDNGDGTLTLDYYGTPMLLTPTQEGMDLDYMGSMLLHMTAD